MKTLKSFFYLSLIAVVLSGCETKTKSAIRGVLKVMNEQSPIVVNDYASIISAELNNDTVVYKMLVTEEDKSMEALKSNPEGMRSFLLLSLTNHNNAEKDYYRMMVSEGLWLRVVYMGQKSKKTVALIFSPDEMKNALENQMDPSGSAELLLKMEVERSDASLPMEIEKGLTWTTVEINDKAVVYTYKVDERYFDVSLVKENGSNIKDGMVPSLSIQKPLLKALIETKRELHYKYVGNKSGRSEVLVFTKDEIKDLAYLP